MTRNDRTAQPPNSVPPGGGAGIPQYEIRVAGHLGTRWSGWFDGLSLTAEDDGTTVIRGPVVDQAALHGLLVKLRDLGIPLVSLAELPSDEASARPEPHDLPPTNNPSGATS